MHILCLNCGSSSVKFELAELVPDIFPPVLTRRLLSGKVDRVGAETVADHSAAVRLILERVHAAGHAIDAVGHRVVHGGPRYAQPVLIDGALLATLEEFRNLAPLHNGPSLTAIATARADLGAGVPMVAAFDTAFHHALPPSARIYALPNDMAARHGIRRYGFHGLAFESVVDQVARLLETSPTRVTCVALHLGSGCSAAAIREGQSVDTSMGFTPLEGLVMGSRSGDVDPALVGYLGQVEGVGPAEVEEMLNQQSGLLGLSGLSADMRALLAAESTQEGARLAIEVFCYRARKYLGAYLAALGGAPAIVFSGGIGANAPAIRARILADMGWCGVQVDEKRNAAAVDLDQAGATCISPADASVKAYVVPADEEGVIVRATARLVYGVQVS